jgi:hypothetical protein
VPRKVLIRLTKYLVGVCCLRYDPDAVDVTIDETVLMKPSERGRISFVSYGSRCHWNEVDWTAPQPEFHRKLGYFETRAVVRQCGLESAKAWLDSNY